MLEIEQALNLVLQDVQPLAPHRLAIADCLSQVLAAPVVSDIDSPPHDKSIVDGYAVSAASVIDGATRLKVLEEVTAGAVPTRFVEPLTATRIMTGAPLPAGADAVVMVEQTETSGDDVIIRQSAVKPGQNIMRRAAAMSRGQTVLEAGKLIRPIEIGLLAEVGLASVTVFAPPRVAVLATGNELVEPQLVPGPGQIRNSNGPMLTALARQAGGQVTDLGIARDTEDDLRRQLSAGIEHDVLLISGGVSAGVLDLVPRVLQQIGVEQVFHKVNLKPGKPLWFGRKTNASGRRVLVFGLPGNPVSSLVCFELFARPAIQKLRGLEPTGLPQAVARLTREHSQRGDRPTFWPAVVNKEDRGLAVTPLAWQGSGDLRALAFANALAWFPPGERRYPAGDEIRVRLLAASG
jgi:molybdopterin molybdotransferase